MTRMIEAGEDPRFVLRRMVIFASEDVGNADPQALGVAVAALQAVELVGLPEGVLPMTQAVIYLALAPKSNARAHDVRGGAQARARARRAAGARALPARLDGARSRAGPRQGLQVPARLRRPLRPRGLPARRAGRRADLRAERVGLRGRARRAAPRRASTRQPQAQAATRAGSSAPSPLRSCPRTPAGSDAGTYANACWISSRSTSGGTSMFWSCGSGRIPSRTISVSRSTCSRLTNSA